MTLIMNRKEDQHRIKFALGNFNLRKSKGGGKRKEKHATNSITGQGGTTKLVKGYFPFGKKRLRGKYQVGRLGRWSGQERKPTDFPEIILFLILLHQQEELSSDHLANSR